MGRGAPASSAGPAARSPLGPGGSRAQSDPRRHAALPGGARRRPGRTRTGPGGSECHSDPDVGVSEPGGPSRGPLRTHGGTGDHRASGAGGLPRHLQRSLLGADRRRTAAAAPASGVGVLRRSRRLGLGQDADLVDAGRQGPGPRLRRLGPDGFRGPAGGFARRSPAARALRARPGVHGPEGGGDRRGREESGTYAAEQGCRERRLRPAPAGPDLHHGGRAGEGAGPDRAAAQGALPALPRLASDRSRLRAAQGKPAVRPPGDRPIAVAQLDRVREAFAKSYAIEREVGQGGMATVYLARDLKHGRQVALKVLRPELAAAMGGDRFPREIQIVAQLSHPHILPLHDSGEMGGFLFYVMPFVEGESLRQKLTRDCRMPVREAVRILREVADALAYAHERGIIHRDIKPDNVMLTGRHAVVTDFGVAKAVSAAGGDTLTTVGLALGTPAYMSPEQAMGEVDLD